MDRIRIYLNNLKNVITRPQYGMRAKVTRVRSHLFIHSSSQIMCMLTCVEVRRLHRHFGNPSRDKLMNLLEPSEIKDAGTESRGVLAGIERNCDSFQTGAQKPRQIRFTLRNDKDFNHTVYEDTLFIEDKAYSSCLR